MTESDFKRLRASFTQLQNGVRCAQRIADCPENPEYGVTFETKAKAISDVLKVAAARADGDTTVGVGPVTMMVMKVILADVEVRLLWDKLGLTHWRPS